MPSAVLVAEPEPETREYLGRQLRDDGFDVLGAARRSEALELAESARPDVVLLAELELCLRLRRGEPGRTWDRTSRSSCSHRRRIPSSESARSTAARTTSSAGPFAYEELLARIRALIRRTHCAPGTSSSPATSSSTGRRAVSTSATRRSLLSAKEFELVAKLASEPHRVCTKEELLREVWGYRALGRTRTLESHARACGRSCASAPTTASS